MFEQLQAETTLVICPDCGQVIRLKGEILVGREVICPNCDAQLQVIKTNPAQLDWVYEEWDVDPLDW